MSILFERKHHLVSEKTPIWERTNRAVSGGHKYVCEALIPHTSEPKEEFQERKDRCAYFNYPRRISSLISQFVFSIDPTRTDADEAIVSDWSRTGTPANNVMRQLAMLVNCHKYAWLLVDMPAVKADAKVNLEDKQTQKIRPFVRALSALSVPDWCEGEDGSLEWAIVEETYIDKTNPEVDPVKCTRRRLWTKTEWKLYQKRSDEPEVKEIDKGTHNLGRVPLIKVVEPENVTCFGGHWFEDVVNISDAMLNHESEAQMNIIKQMFGLLVVSESVVLSAKKDVDDATGIEKLSQLIGRSCALWERPDEKGIIRYVSPSGSETAEIRSEIKELKAQLYDTVGLAIQSTSREAQTAESKAWDSNNVQRFLSERSEMLEDAEREAWKIMNLWDNEIKIPSVTYNRDFAVVDLKTAVDALLNIDNFATGDEFRREVSRAALELLHKVKRVAPEVRKIIEAEINEYIKPVLPIPEFDPNGVDGSGNSNDNAQQ